MTDPNDPVDVRSEFIEKVGLIAQGNDLPRAAGRMLGLLIFDGEATSFSALAEQLQISRGSVSTATRLLQERGLIKRLTKPGERQEYFQLAETPYASMLAGVKTGIDRAHSEITDTLAKLPAHLSGPANRISEYARLYQALGHAIDQAISDIGDGQKD